MKRQSIRVSALVLITLPAGEHLNDKVIEGLATTLKVDSKKLQEQLVTKESDPTKMESKLTDLIPADAMFLQKAEFDSALDRKGKERFDVGRFDEREMAAKDLLKKAGIAPEDMKGMSVSKREDYNAYIETVLNKYGERVKTEAGVTPDKQVEALKKEKDALQQIASDKDKQIQNLKDQYSTEKQATSIHGQVAAAINGIEIDIADDKIAGQRKMLTNAFLGEYDFKQEDGKTVIYEKGTDKKLVDTLLKPISIEDALKDFAPGYVSIKTPTGRGDKANNNTLTGDLAKIKDKAGFMAYLTSQGIIDLYSEKAQAVLTEIKSKNPNFKLA